MQRPSKLSQELHKSITRKSEKRKIYSSFKGNMQLISKFNKGFTILLCVIDIYSKYACMVGITITNACQKFER